MVRIFGFSGAGVFCAGEAAETSNTNAETQKARRNGEKGKRMACPPRKELRRTAEWPLPYARPASVSVKGGNAGDLLTDHQTMDVVRAFVGVHRFQVVHVAHDAVIVHDAVGPQDFAG